VCFSCLHLPPFTSKLTSFLTFPRIAMLSSVVCWNVPRLSDWYFVSVTFTVQTQASCTVCNFTEF
jgi:hypothetical protein